MYSSHAHRLLIGLAARELAGHLAKTLRAAGQAVTTVDAGGGRLPPGTVAVFVPTSASLVPLLLERVWRACPDGVSAWLSDAPGRPRRVDWRVLDRPGAALVLVLPGDAGRGAERCRPTLAAARGFGAA
jgi:hypothetical protein